MSFTQTSDQRRAHNHDDGTPGMKGDSEYVERLAHANTNATYIEKEEIATLSEEHGDYLLRRHGTLNLDPIPGLGDADPYN
jgi:hypothetical protein